MTFENAIVPTGPATNINKATVSANETPNLDITIKNVAIIIAINPSPIRTFDVFLWKHNFNEDRAPTNKANMTKYKTYIFIISPNNYIIMLYILYLTYTIYI